MRRLRKYGNQPFIQLAGLGCPNLVEGRLLRCETQAKFHWGFMSCIRTVQENRETTMGVGRRPEGALAPLDFENFSKKRLFS